MRAAEAETDRLSSLWIVRVGIANALLVVKGRYEFHAVCTQEKRQNSVDQQVKLDESAKQVAGLQKRVDDMVQVFNMNDSPLLDWCPGCDCCLNLLVLSLPVALAGVYNISGIAAVAVAQSVHVSASVKIAGPSTVASLPVKLSC